MARVAPGLQESTLRILFAVALLPGLAAGIAAGPAATVGREASEGKPLTVDIAPFGRVMTWDPRQEKLLPGRTEEFPAEFVFPGQELAKESGGYRVVGWGEAGAAIGLRWEVNRFVRFLSVTFEEANQCPAASEVRVQFWHGEESRESLWQGEWLTLNSPIRRDGKQLNCTVDAGTDPGSILADKGTLKIRWLLPEKSGGARVESLSAWTVSRWEDIELRLEAAQTANSTTSVELFNGLFLPSGGIEQTWETRRPLEVRVRYSVPPADPAGAHYADRTLLSVTLGETPFTVAVEDVLAEGPVYVRQAGVLVTSSDDGENLESVRARVGQKETIRERVVKRSDQRLSAAMKMRHPAGNRSPTLLSLAGANQKYVLQPAGVLTVPGRLHLTPEFGLDRFELANWMTIYGSGGRPKRSPRADRITRRLHGEWMPIPVNSFEEDGILYSQRTFVAPLDESRRPHSEKWLGDSRGVCVSQFEIVNQKDVPAEVRLGLSLELSRWRRGRAAQPFREPVELARTDSNLVASEGQLWVLVNTDDAGPLQVEVVEGKVVLSGRLGAREEACCVLYLSQQGPVDGSLTGGKEKGRALLEATEEYWRSALQPGTQIEVPDPFLMNVLRSSVARILSNARNEGDGERVAPWIAANTYGPLENEAQTLIRAMSEYGQLDFGRHGLAYFLSKYNRTGALTTGYTLMGTGWNLFSIAEYFDLTGDREWLKSVAAPMMRACRWIIRQREKTKALDAEGKKVREYGLIPPGVTGDWGRFAYRFYSQAIHYAGLSNAARVLSENGYPGTEDLVQEAEAFRQDIARAYQRIQARSPVLPLPNGEWVLPYPCSVYGRGRTGLLYPSGNRSNTYTYDLDHGAHHLYALGVLDPNSAIVEDMLDQFEDDVFLIDAHLTPAYSAEQNRQEWYDRGGFSKYYIGHNRTATIYALRKEERALIRAAFNWVPSYLDTENMTFWEHNYSAAWDKTHCTARGLLQFRRLFVDEQEDSLWLALAVPEYYLENGKKVRVREAPTRFGTVSYSLESSTDRGYIEATVESPTRQPPREILLRVRHPGGSAIRSVRLNGKPYADFDAKPGIVRLEPRDTEVRLRLEY